MWTGSENSKPATIQLSSSTKFQELMSWIGEKEENITSSKKYNSKDIGTFSSKIISTQMFQENDIGPMKLHSVSKEF
jgi:hypothetical protein